MNSRAPYLCHGLRRAGSVAVRSPALNSLELLFGSRLSEGRSRKVAAPAPGLLDSLFGFVGYSGGAGVRARERILRIVDELSSEERADAFSAIPEFAAGLCAEDPSAAPVIELRFNLLEAVTGDVASEAASTSLVHTANYRCSTIVGFYDSGIGDLSEKHDQYLAQMIDEENRGGA